MSFVTFSGSTSSQRSYTALQAGDYSYEYAVTSHAFANVLVAAGTPYLSSGVFLNVNYPVAGSGRRCATGVQCERVGMRQVVAAEEAHGPQHDERMPRECGRANASTKGDATAAQYQFKWWRLS
jgi:hypothetical protein